VEGYSKMDTPRDGGVLRGQEMAEREEQVRQRLEAIERDKIQHPPFDEQNAEAPDPVDQVEADGTLTMSREQLLDAGREPGSLSRPEPRSPSLEHGLMAVKEDIGLQPPCGHHTYEVSGYCVDSAELAMEKAGSDLHEIGFSLSSEAAQDGLLGRIEDTLGFGTDGDHIGKDDGAYRQAWRDGEGAQEHLRVVDAYKDEKTGMWTVEIRAETPSLEERARRKLERLE